jgi:hypothetical protein
MLYLTIKYLDFNYPFNLFQVNIYIKNEEDLLMLESFMMAYITSADADVDMDLGFHHNNFGSKNK